MINETVRFIADSYKNTTDYYNSYKCGNIGTLISFASMTGIYGIIRIGSKYVYAPLSHFVKV